MLANGGCEGTVYTARTQERRATTQHGARHADRMAWTQHEIGREWRTNLPTSTMKIDARIFATYSLAEILKVFPSEIRGRRHASRPDRCRGRDAGVRFCPG